MNVVSFVRRLGVALVLLSVARSVAADDLPTVALPKPHMDGGKPLMQALKERKSTRAFKPDALSLQTQSDLLWAAFGVNRPDIDHRTAPSAMNMQEIDIYVARADGVYLYEAKPHQLRRVLNADVRAKTTGQAELKEAPIALIFVADHARMIKPKPEQKEKYTFIDAGFISQNVYLYCASEGLATVVHELDREPLAQALNLRPEQKIVIAQAVGHPK